MKTVHKFRLEIKDIIEIEMPIGAELLYFDMQYGVPTLWALVKEAPEVEKTTRYFRIAGTGHPLPDKTTFDNYCGTCFDRQFVWHLFEFSKPTR